MYLAFTLKLVDGGGSRMYESSTLVSGTSILLVGDKQNCRSKFCLRIAGVCISVLFFFTCLSDENLGLMKSLRFSSPCFVSYIQV